MLFVTISIILFEYRFILKMLKKPVAKPFQVIPHVNDTLLLVTGVSLAFIASINPVHQTWLATKIVTLVFYIILGAVALKANDMKSIYAYVLATATLILMLFTAITKTSFW